MYESGRIEGLGLDSVQSAPSTESGCRRVTINRLIGLDSEVFSHQIWVLTPEADAVL